MPWPKGRPQPESTKRINSLKMKGKKNPYYGKKHSTKIRAIISERTRKAMTSEIRKKLSEIKLAQHNHHTQGWKKENSIRTRALFTSERRKTYSKRMQKEGSPNWRGGKSFEKYTVDWTATLRRAVRERDKYRCQDCGEQQGDYAFDVHHEDGNKENCRISNLVTLCRSCHQSRHQIEKRLR